MAVRIRLMRMGKKKQPTYRVVVADQRSPRDGRFIERIGRYDPRQEPSVVEINSDRAVYWLQEGAQPSDRVRKLLEISGAWGRFMATRGVVHTVGSPSTDEQPTDEQPAKDAPEQDPEQQSAEGEAAAEEATVE